MNPNEDPTASGPYQPSTSADSDVVAAKAEQLRALERQKTEKERELAELRDLERKQTECDRNRVEMLESLRKSLVILEHEEERTQQQLEKIGATRLIFRELLEQIEAINPESWAPANLSAELTRTLTQLENARIEFQRARAQLAALDDHARSAMLRGKVSSGSLAGLRFRDWVKIGFAITLPLLTLGLLLLVLLLVWSQKYTPHVGPR